MSSTENATGMKSHKERRNAMRAVSCGIFISSDGQREHFCFVQDSYCAYVSVCVCVCCL